MKEKILEIENLSLSYTDDEVICKDINLTLSEGEVLGIAGGSGSGKSTLLKAILDPTAYGIKILNGTIRLKGREIINTNDKDRRKIKGHQIGMILQNPFASFNPLRKYKKQFKETLKSHDLWSDENDLDKILSVLEDLGLPDGERIMESCPYEMSGGMNQRIAIALAMLLQPFVLLADEPTSALDVTSQKQVLDEFLKLKEKYKVSIIIVAHGIDVLASVCDNMAVMNKGKIVEYGKTHDVILHPNAEYTKKLFEALPVIGTMECITDHERENDGN